MSDLGFNILAKSRGYTNTHMFLINISPIISAPDAEKLLESANIIVNRNLLPGDSSFLKPSGLRVGTPEMTRLGAKENDMGEIAPFFKRVLLDKENTDNIKNDVINFRKRFKKIQYCYQEDEYEK